MTEEKQKTDTTASLTFGRVPQGDLPERVLAMANGAKSALYYSGTPSIPDEVLIRVAMGLDCLIRARHGSDDAAGATALFALHFAVEPDPKPARAALLATKLDPVPDEDDDGGQS